MRSKNKSLIYLYFFTLVFIYFFASIFIFVNNEISFTKIEARIKINLKKYRHKVKCFHK